VTQPAGLDSPVASLMRFVSKLVLAASESFFSFDAASHVALAAISPPTASTTHFFSKLVFAAPASFFSFDEASQVALASFSHFVMNEVLAAPASFVLGGSGTARGTFSQRGGCALSMTERLDHVWTRVGQTERQSTRVPSTSLD